MSHDIGKSRNSTPRCLRLLPRQTTPHQYVAFLDCGKRRQTDSWCFCPRVYHHTAQYTLIDEPLPQCTYSGVLVEVAGPIPRRISLVHNRCYQDMAVAELGVRASYFGGCAG